MSTFVNLLEVVYPVGSVYLTAQSTSPATTFGGTWSKVTGGCVAAAGTTGFATADSTGGSTIISVDQMPKHQHYTNNSDVVYNANGSIKLGSGTGAVLAQDRLYTNFQGGGKAYYPAHVSFNVYKRTA